MINMRRTAGVRCSNRGTEPLAQELAIRGGNPTLTEPFAGWPVVDDREVREVEAVIREGVWGVGGTRLDAFAERFAEFQHVRHVLPVANGTIAIDMALEALDVRCGDEVIVPDYTFVATAVAPLRRGVRPVLVDVKPDTFNIDPDRIEAAITDRTRAVIVVHFGGHPCDMARIMHLADRYGLRVIEDCAHAHGAHRDGQHAGAWGEIGTFSFQSSKTLCCGEGGAVVTGSSRLHERLKAIHNAGRHGCMDDYNHFTNGTNYRMTELQGGLLLAQMARLEELCNLRHRQGGRLNALLDRIDGVRPQARADGLGRHGHYLYPFVLEADVPRDAFKKALKAEGVPVEDQYPALHTIECLRKSGVTDGAFPVASEIADRSVWIFHHALMAEDAQIDRIAAAVEKVLAARADLTTI